MRMKKLNEGTEEKTLGNEYDMMDPEEIRPMLNLVSMEYEERKWLRKTIKVP